MNSYVRWDDRASSPAERQAAEALIRSLRRVKGVVETQEARGAQPASVFSSHRVSRFGFRIGGG